MATERIGHQSFRMTKQLIMFQQPVVSWLFLTIRGIGVAEMKRRMGILRLIAVESIAAHMSVETAFLLLTAYIPQL